MRIAISGAGIAGPTLAWWLRRYGHQPVMFERALAVRRGGYIIDFWGSGYSVAEKMGLLPAIHRDGYVIERLKSVTSSGLVTSSVGAGTFSEIAGGRYLSIARSDLARRIFDACGDIETRFGCTIDAISQDDHKVRLGLSDGSTDEFDLLIGADGLHSRTRELVFGAQTRFERKMGLHVAAFVLPGYRPRDELTYVQFTKPNRQISRIALRDDQTLFLFVFHESLLDAELDDEAGPKTVLREIFGGMGWEADAILVRIDEVADVYFDRVSQIELSRWAKGRVALLGDAAACPSLLAGEGTGLAMTEAYVLAGELRRAQSDYGAAFAAYEGKLQSYVATKQAGARRFKGFFAPRSWLGLVLRELAMNLTAVPGLAKPLLGAGMSNELALPEYGD